MTDEEIRIAVAKYLGWRFAGDVEFDAYTKNWGSADKWCAPPGTDFSKWKPEHPLVNRPHLVFVHGTPRYTECLNAMHEAEKACIVGRHDEVYREHLAKPAREFDGANGNCLSEDAYVDCCTYATARQRAEAFLRTLNLWKD